MARYFAAVFSDLVQHSVAWNRLPRQKMLAVIGEYRYLAESTASHYGTQHSEFKGDGHLFLFGDADASVQFALTLIKAWKSRTRSMKELEGLGSVPLRVGCHYGECTAMSDGDIWIGRGANLAKRVEESADPDTLFVTESVLELLDLPRYEFKEVGQQQLKGDHLSKRMLYEVVGFDPAQTESEPSAESLFLRAVSQIGTDKEHREQEAVCYRDALNLRPDFPEAHNNLAILLRRLGDEAGAGEHYREALRLRPNYPEAHYNYGILLEARRSFEGAAEHYRLALELHPHHVDAHHRYANLLKVQGDLEQAERHYRQVLELRPGYVEAHNNYALLLEDLGKLEQAAEHYEEALRLQGDYAPAHYNYALFLETHGNITPAEKHYREALRVWPDYPEAHNNLAILLQGRGDLQAAEDHYRESLRLRPNDPETHYNYALLLRAKGEEKEAHEHFRLARELAPDVPAFQSAIDSPC